MSAPAFTLGPWELHRYDTSYYNGPNDAGEPYVITAPNDGVVLAVAVPDAVPQANANARLIAAAPELYAVCDMIAKGATSRMIVEPLRAALAKARGE